MALGDYTPTAWINGATPAINATTLGHLETKVNELDDNAVAAQALVNIKTVDGTGSGLDADLLDGIHATSFAPIPKAYSSGTTVGESTTVELTNGAVWTNPGGTWNYWNIKFTVATNLYAGFGSGTTTGNITSGAGQYWVLMLWRIA